jgi:hypothetical protein
MAKKLKDRGPLQPRLAPDVEKMVRQSSARNSRTCPQEVNHILREHYTAGLTRLLGIKHGP